MVLTDPLPSGVSFGQWVQQGSALLPPPDDTITWGPWDIAAHAEYAIAFTAIVTTNTAYAGAAVDNTVEFVSGNAGSGSDAAVFTIAGTPPPCPFPLTGVAINGPTDVDWAYFDGQAGTTYIVMATTPADSSADVALAVYDACDDLDPERQNHTFSPDVRLRFEAPHDGTYYLKLNNAFLDIGQNAEYHLSVRAVILAAGRLTDSDPVQDNIYAVTDSAYRLFRGHGYTATVETPTGAVTETTTLSYTAFTVAPSTLPTGYLFAGRGFHLRAYQYGQLVATLPFHHPVTLTVRYSDADVATLNEETLQLFFRDGGAWSTDGLVVVERDLQNRRLVLTTSHATEFALFGQEKRYTIYLPLVLRQ